MNSRSLRDAVARRDKLSPLQSALWVAIAFFVLLEIVAPDRLGVLRAVGWSRWLLETSFYPAARLRSAGLGEEQLAYVAGVYVLVGASYAMLVVQSTWLSLIGAPVNLPPGYFRRYLYFHRQYVYRDTGAPLSWLMPTPKFLTGGLELERTDSRSHIRAINQQIDAIGTYAVGALAFFMMFEGAHDALLHSKVGFALAVLICVLPQAHVLFDAVLYLLSRWSFLRS